MGKPTVEGVRRHWKAAAAHWRDRSIFHQERVTALSNQLASESTELQKAQQTAHYNKGQWIDTQSRLQKAERQRDELERINKSKQGALEVAGVAIQDLTDRLTQAGRTQYKLICILDNVTHPERGES